MLDSIHVFDVTLVWRGLWRVNCALLNFSLSESWCWRVVSGVLGVGAKLSPFSSSCMS